MQDDEWTINVESWVWPFGRNKGKTLAETPVAYLSWVSENFDKGKIRKAVRLEIARRSPQAAKRLGIKVDEPGHVQGRYDCLEMHNPLAEWPEGQEWDGRSPPWVDQRSVRVASVVVEMLEG